MKAVTVSDYMTRQLVTFKPETTLYEAMNVMLDKRISGAPVVDDAGAILGVISEIDFLDAMLKAAYYGHELEIQVGRELYKSFCPYRNRRNKEQCLG